jgi:hypothetical protein
MKCIPLALVLLVVTLILIGDAISVFIKRTRSNHLDRVGPDELTAKNPDYLDTYLQAMKEFG